LGLRTLTVIDETAKLLRQTRGLALHLDALPLDDAATYAVLASAETMGVFQLESSGMRDLLKKLRPSQFEDLVALLALYRPGPIGSGMLDDFMQRKHGEQRFAYDHPKLEPILKETHGILVYQEQVMRIANELAGFSLAQADLLRRAMGKKIPEVMERERQGFLEGCLKHGVTKRVAEKTFRLMEHFAGYGFNKSHSTAYAMISYRTAYLKANFPHEFMTALLTSELGNTDKVVVYVEEAKRLGFHVAPPDVNTSFAIFTIADAGTIRFGLAAIKNVGRAAIEAMVAERQRGGAFHDLFDFCERLDSRLVNRKVIESLIKSGAMDGFDQHRAQLMAQLEQAMNLASTVQADRSRGQLSLFDARPEAGSLQPANGDHASVREWPEHQRLMYERELLGFYISGHPLARYASLLATHATTTTQELSSPAAGGVIVGGMLTKVKHTITKRTSEQMAICRLEDLKGEVELLVFPKAYPEASKHLRPNAVVFVRGTVSLREDQPRLIADEVIPAEQAALKFAKALELSVLSPEVEEPFLRELQVLLARFPGTLPVYLTMTAPQQTEPVRLMLGRRFAVAPDPALVASLETLLGPGSVQLK